MSGRAIGGIAKQALLAALGPLLAAGRPLRHAVWQQLADENPTVTNVSARKRSAAIVTTIRMITATMVSSKESRLYSHAAIASRPTSAVKSAILPSTAKKAGSQQAVRKLESRRSLRELSV